MNKTKLLKLIVVIGLSLLLVANLASVVFADDATYGWDDPTASSTGSSSSTGNTSGTTGNTGNTAGTASTNISTGSTSNVSNSSISTGTATTTLNTSSDNSNNSVNTLAYTGAESNSVLVVVILVGAIVAGYSLKKVKEYNNI